MQGSEEQDSDHRNHDFELRRGYLKTIDIKQKLLLEADKPFQGDTDRRKTYTKTDMSCTEIKMVIDCVKLGRLNHAEIARKY